MPTLRRSGAKENASACFARNDRLGHGERSCVGAVAFFVFFAGAAGAGVVAADFGAGADGFWGFGLRGACLILQLFLLALLFALHGAGEVGKALRSRRFAGAGSGSTGNGGVRAGTHRGSL